MAATLLPTPTRSFEHVEMAAEPGGPMGEGGAFPISPEQRFSLEHRADLLNGTSELWGCCRCSAWVVPNVHCKVAPFAVVII